MYSSNSAPALHFAPAYLGVKVFVNQEELDFGSAADGTATQEFELVPNRSGDGFVNTRQGPFTNVTAVAFYFT